MDYLNYDLELLEKELLEHSSRLFVDYHESYIQVIEAGGPRESFCDPDSGHADRVGSILSGGHDLAGGISTRTSSYSLVH